MSDANTIIGTKKDFLNFIKRNVKDDAMIIITSAWKTVTASSKRSKTGCRIELVYAKDTFKQEDGVSPLLSGNNFAMWIGHSENISASSKKMLADSKKKKAKKGTPAKRRPR